MASLLSRIAGNLVGGTPLLLAFSTAPSFALLWTAMRVATAPLPMRFFERGDELMYDLYQSFVSFFYEHWAGVRLVFHGDVLPTSLPNVTLVPLPVDNGSTSTTAPSSATATATATDTATDTAAITPPLPSSSPESVLYFSNHQCSADWIVVDLLALRNSALGRIRYIMKRSLRFLPLYGWYFAMHSCVFVRKNWTHDQKRLEESLLRFQKRQMPLWLVIFPEGTRFTPNRKADALEKSRQYCKERNWPEFDQVLPPRVNGFRLCAHYLRSHIDAVYDVTVVYSKSDEWKPSDAGKREDPPSMLDLLARRYKRIDIHIRRYPIDSLPVSDEGLAQWLVDRFAEKNERLNNFFKTGSFAIANEKNAQFALQQLVREERVNPLRTFAKVALLLSTLVPFAALKSGPAWYLKLWVFGSLLGMAVTARY